jgi:hypothetical protein
MFVREFQLKHLANFHLTFFITQLAVGQMPALKDVKGPEASAIDKIIDVPVGMYSGIANVNIPLYSISIKGVNVPVSLSYIGGGGIKVDEEATMVGPGWKLNYGRAVTRKLHNVPDEHGFLERQALANFFQLPDLNQDPGEAQRNAYIRYTKDVTIDVYDLSPDEFFYSAGS